MNQELPSAPQVNVLPANKGVLSRSLLAVLGSFWIGAMFVGFSILAKEEFTPCETLKQTSAFPLASGIQLDPTRPSLLLFAHPHCPCTKASFAELDRLLASIQNKVFVVIIFTIPNGAPLGWEEGDLLQTAKRMPGVNIFRDAGGKEAVRFGARGSGQVFLYATSGKLLFSGGITGSRGHEGDNLGRSSVTSLVLNGHPPVTSTPVFGCSLL